MCVSILKAATSSVFGRQWWGRRIIPSPNEGRVESPNRVVRYSLIEPIVQQREGYAERDKVGREQQPADATGQKSTQENL